MIVVPTDRKILLYGPAMVNIESADVEQDDYPQLMELRKYMLSIMRSSNAVGLSAPQIGVFKRYFVFERDDKTVVDMVNPEITWMRGKEITGLEACLSVPPPNNECLVPRMEYVTIEYAASDMPAVRLSIDLGRRDAVVAQHEYDHLTGTFFFDRVSNAAKSKILDSFYKWKQETKKNGTAKNDS